MSPIQHDSPKSAANATQSTLRIFKKQICFQKSKICQAEQKSVFDNFGPKTDPMPFEKKDVKVADAGLVNCF